jgi:hypothetical protein
VELEFGPDDEARTLVALDEPLEWLERGRAPCPPRGLRPCPGERGDATEHPAALHGDGRPMDSRGPLARWEPLG